MSTAGESTMGAPVGADEAAPPRRRRRGTGSLTADLLVLGVVGVLLLAAFAAAGATLYTLFYGPSAFVMRYAEMLADGDASQALSVPGVAVDSSELEAAGLPPTAHEALLRSSTLGTLSDIRVVSETESDGVHSVELAYTAGGHEATTTFTVVQDGTIGIFPRWEFAQSPLAVMELTVDGSSTFSVNGFTVDKRQVSPDGASADLSAPVALLVFSPGIYAVSVDSPTAQAPGIAMLSDVPFANVPVSVTATATDEFVTLVQDKVDAFLAECATQQVLQPTACPFGFELTDRIVTLPTWSIVQGPTVELVADGAGWRIVGTEALAHIDVRVRSLFDGRVSDMSVDVPFAVRGTIEILPDGTASILIG